MSNDNKNTGEIFGDQDDHDELVEIDQDGNVYKPGTAVNVYNKKTSILRDPEGEY